MRASSIEESSEPIENSDNKNSLLNALLIAEGGLEDAVERKIIKQVDSDLSKTRLFPLNIHFIMVKFSLKCQARVLKDENRWLRGVRDSEELLERKFSSNFEVHDQQR